MSRASLARTGPLLALALLAGAPLPARADDGGLRPLAELARIGEPRARAAALFTEMGKVLQHPRCVNCHPSASRPLQGDEARPHEPPVTRGQDGLGMVGMRCSACHDSGNYDPAGIPGNPHWKLAPASMAWEGRSLRQICQQLKDPSRNGGRSLAEIAHHMAVDPLVGWAWSPGPGRTSPPGNQTALGALAEAWVAAGAACPGD